MGLIIKPTLIAGDRGDDTVNALFYSGASASFLRKDIAQRVATASATPAAINFTLADGSGTLQVGETVNLNITINEVTVYFSVLVSEDLSEEMIIGADMLQRWKIRLDPELEEVDIDPRATRLRL